jgi:oligopeptidase B
MAIRLKAAVQHLHGRIRVDENWYMNDMEQVVVVKDN